jgi:hypothetical protein
MFDEGRNKPSDNRKVKTRPNSPVKTELSRTENGNSLKEEMKLSTMFLTEIEIMKDKLHDLQMKNEYLNN